MMVVHARACNRACMDVHASACMHVRVFPLFASADESSLITMADDGMAGESSIMGATAEPSRQQTTALPMKVA